MASTSLVASLSKGPAQIDRIPVAGPWITQREIEYVTDAVEHGWYENATQYVRRFEEALARYVGRRHAIATPSCTSAIHVALAAVGIGPGDEVVVPECTWIATAAPIGYLGATPVFADVDPQTWCLDARSVERVLTDRTRAVIPVDLYGGMPNYEALERLCAEHGLAMIEDAAEALGSQFKSKRAGSLGVASVFSFHGSKTFVTGEGGALVTDDSELYERSLVLVDHGRIPGDTFFFNQEVAFKYKMSNLQAALGLAQIERADELVARKQEIFGWYRDELAGDPRVTLNAEPPDTLNSYWMVTVLLDAALGLQKRQVIYALDKAGIDSRPFFHPLSSLPAYETLPGVERAQRLNSAAYALSPRGVNLPSGFNLTREIVTRVCQELRSILDQAA